VRVKVESSHQGDTKRRVSLLPACMVAHTMYKDTTGLRSRVHLLPTPCKSQLYAPLKFAALRHKSRPRLSLVRAGVHSERHETGFVIDLSAHGAAGGTPLAAQRAAAVIAAAAVVAADDALQATPVGPTTDMARHDMLVAK